MKNYFQLFTLFFVSYLPSFGQLNQSLLEYADEVSYNKKQQANFITLKKSMQIKQENAQKFIEFMVLNNSKEKVNAISTEKDVVGFTHTKYSVSQNGIEIFNKRIVSHCQNGKLISLNGDLFPTPVPCNQFVINEGQALTSALKKVNAKKYMWENKARESQMKKSLNQPDFSFYPKGKKVILEKDGKTYFTYQFNIYAQEPLYRANVFVDAANGNVLYEQNLICKVDVQGTALTLYSGTQTITCDQTGTDYRLRETQRGLGIETYNLGGGTNYSAVNDFTNSTTSWTTTGFDQAALDAHWGAEKTYDYYMTSHSRNSIDGAGYALLSYVHYSVTYSNAFWDGQVMTYGDGDATQYTAFTSLDVCGHEITHGLVGNTAGLSGGEADALNESYADIFGTCIERYARPNNWNWKMGEDISVTNSPIRDMQNPSLFSDPDTYLGPNWVNGGDPHKNGGPNNYWFYLLTMGGSGTNGINNTYSVSGLGNVKAEAIAFRALTVYFTPGTDYANARVLTIRAAKDLYGNCSNEVIQTINAWYAVGVGQKYVQGISNSDFVADNTSICSLPANVNFTNLTGIGTSYFWNFGDGSTSTSTNPAHTYTANGNYSVKLKSVGCANSTDSVTKTAYISVNAPNPPVVGPVSRCGPGSIVINATGGSVYNWYSSPTSTNVLYTGSSFTTPALVSNTTYYVVNSLSNTPVSVGIPNNTVGTGAFGTYTDSPLGGLQYNVLNSCILLSVDIYSQNSGTVIILETGLQPLVYLNTVATLTAGLNTVPLNFTLAPGMHFLMLDYSSNPGNYYITSGPSVNFPYSANGLVTISGSINNQNDYEYFYNIKFVKNEVCSSLPTAITASVVADCTGLTSYYNQSDVFNIFPNPATSNLNIKHNLNKNVALLITDASGRVVLNNNLLSNEENIQLDNLANGMYFIYFKDDTGNNLKTTKFIKQ